MTFLLGLTKITGTETLTILNLQSASFKWTFNFPKTDISYLAVSKFESDGKEVTILQGTTSDLTIIKNTAYTSRTQFSWQSSSGIVVDISKITVPDGGKYKCLTYMNSGGPVFNTTNLVVLGKSASTFSHLLMWYIHCGNDVFMADVFFNGNKF